MNQETLFARHQWLSNSHFHELDEAAVFQCIDRKLKSTSDPVVLFDLDSTLYEVAPRNLAIIADWLKTEGRAFSNDVQTSLARLSQTHIGYSLKDTFQAIGLSLESPTTFKAWEHLKDYWWARFFTNHYLHHDIPYPGGVEYAKQVFAAGAKVVYLTGRDEPNMGEGTRKNLVRDGFPMDPTRTHLLLKSHGDKEDLQHKKDAIHFVRKFGTLVASFENEPANFVALQELFPEACHIFVETVFSDNPAKPAKNAYRIRTFGAK